MSAAFALIGGGPALAEELPSGASAVFREAEPEWPAREEGAVASPAAPPVMERKQAALPRLSSGFGYRTNPILRRRMLHSGIDIPGPVGTAVLASDSGVVRHAGIAGGYGKMVEIAHANGLVTRYAHLSRIMVGPGAAVRQGEPIGLMGSTGRSTGSHLHFEIRSGGKAIDPAPLLGDYSPGSAAYSRVSMAAVPEPHVSQFAKERELSGARGLDF